MQMTQYCTFMLSLGTLSWYNLSGLDQNLLAFSQESSLFGLSFPNETEFSENPCKVNKKCCKACFEAVLVKSS